MADAQCRFSPHVEVVVVEQRLSGLLGEGVPRAAGGLPQGAVRMVRQSGQDVRRHEGRHEGCVADALLRVGEELLVCRVGQRFHVGPVRHRACRHAQDDLRGRIVEEAGSLSRVCARALGEMGPQCRVGVRQDRVDNLGREAAALSDVPPDVLVVVFEQPQQDSGVCGRITGECLQGGVVVIGHGVSVG
ncbi:hypothetical protein [Streptomyces sp. NPDC001070]